jgi:mono/diheme cytochrome c family protein
MRRVIAIALLALLSAAPPAAADDVLMIEVGETTRRFAVAELLARSDAAEIQILKDASYGQPMTFTGVPLASLLEGLVLPADSVLEAVASDGFTAQLPLHLVFNTDPARAVPYVAIEPADKPWPPLPGQDKGPGPLYLVWAGSDLSVVRSEHWAWHPAMLAARDAPAKRWPQIAVDPALPPTDPLRTGQGLFVTQCMSCHRFNDAGSADAAPALTLPSTPTDAPALGALLRAPPADGQAGHGLGPDKLSDGEIGLIADYLRHMASRATPPG